VTHAPGPRGRELLAVIGGRRRDPVALLMGLRERHGPIVRIRVGDTSQFLVSSPEGVRHVLVENSRNYTKGPAYELLGELLGQGLVTSEGEHWLTHRRLVQPTLGRDRLDGFVPLMLDAARTEAAELVLLARTGATVDAYVRMNALALRIVTRTLLGADAAAREDEVHHALAVVFDYIESLSSSRLRFLELLPGGSRTRGLRRRLSRLPTRARREFDRAIATLDAVIFDVIERRRGEAGAGTDLVSALLRAKDGAAALSDRDVRDEVMTMYVAGHETVATALTWTLHLLATHPDVQERVAVEADALLPDTADVASSGRFDLTRRVIEESMRLYPPVWRVSRFAREDDVIDSFPVRAGSVVVVSPFVVHRDPTHWVEPDRFDPDRFMPERVRARARSAYIPFGAGQRMCPGGGFSMLESLLVLATLCRALRFTSQVRGAPGFEPRVTLRPAGGMPLTLDVRA
jgi:cytochrome P450